MKAHNFSNSTSFEVEKDSYMNWSAQRRQEGGQMKDKKWIAYAFVGGFLATLIFHQGLVGLLHLLGVLPMQPYNMSATKPFGVPSVISLSFFGGLWGILIWRLVRNDPKVKQLIKSIVYGAIGPTLVAFVVVFPLKGISPPLALIPVGLLLNGAWGLGVWLFMKIEKSSTHRTA